MFDFLTSTRRPDRGTPVLTAKQVLARLKALNRRKVPWRVADGSDEGVDLIAEWRIADERWSEIFMEAGLRRVYKIHMRLDEAARQVRAQDRSYDVFWAAGVPTLLLARGFRGQKWSKEFEATYTFGEGLQVEKESEWRFETSEMKKPLQEAVTACGWTYRGVVFGKV